jgi:predicted ATPase
MIKKIGIENFRIFKNYTEFELTPITVLTGPNNSGKSSFLKLLRLLQYSFTDDKGLEFLNFDGEIHNLESFDKVRNWDSNSKQIKIVLDFPLSYFDEKFQLELIYSSSGMNYSSRENGNLKSFKIFNKNRILFRYFGIDDDFDIIDEPLDDFSLYYLLDIEYLQHCKEKENNFTDKDSLFYDYFKVNKDENDKKEVLNKKYFQILSIIEKYFISNKYYPVDYLTEMKDDFYIEIEFHRSINQILEGKELKGVDKIEIDLLKKGISEKEFNEFVEDIPLIKIDIKEGGFEIYKKYIENNIKESLKKIKFSLNNFSYLSATRGSKERILSNISNYDINEIVKQIYPIHQEKVYSTFIKKSFDLLKIKGELLIERLEGVVYVVYLKQGNQKIPLSEMGYGYSQIIPIILKIINISGKEDELMNIDNPYDISDLPTKDMEEENNKIKGDPGKFSKLFIKNPYFDIINYRTNYPTLIIEEPESNLHPDLQSKLVDVLVLAYKTFNIHFILETHSEYLVRKLQYLTVKKEITQDDTVIYYFNTDEKEEKVKEIKIDEFGGLTDTFGSGFIDESISLQFEIHKLTQAQSN